VLDPVPREWVRHIWLDFQDMSAFEADPLIAVEARGMRVRTDDGREFIDAIGGAIVSGLGYGNETVRAAMHASIDRLDFWPVLHGTTPAALRLARRLSELLPGDLDTAFLLSGGSEATETAMKMARAYHANVGSARRFKVISRYGSYHGATLGALSASGVGDRLRFEPLPAGFVHVAAPYCYRCPWGKSPDSCNIECARTIEDTIRQEGRETVSAVIADPVMAGAGVLVPPKAYYSMLRDICDRTGVLLIFDEVLTGFGRLGTLFAADYYEVVPDLICLGKGISSGYAPLAAVVAREHIAAAFRGDPAKIFLHGHTYGGHPLACDTGLAVIDEIVGRDLVRQARQNGVYLGERLSSLAEKHPEIGDVRGLGMLWCLEFVTDRLTKTPFPTRQSFAIAARRQAKAAGLLTRGSPHTLILAPPLTVSRSDLDEIVEMVDLAIGRAREEMRA
jgi:adenosylmethionine-8-amino-7-oxononanoate aminotransferase